MIRLAAVGDLHFGDDSAGTWAPHLVHLADAADALLLAGDLTRFGRGDEAAVLAAELLDVHIPVVAVLGNHDYHSDESKAIVDLLDGAGVTVLEGDATVLEVGGASVGVAGTKGFGGGFAGANATAFGEPEMKAFVDHSVSLADELAAALDGLDTDWRVALLHYAPVKDTVRGERPEIFPFLGSYLFAEAVDAVGADLVVHGHAHHGCEKGVTPGGIHVRNVAQPVLRRSYAVYCLGESGDGAG
jgi:Icc-related predicted phosphoesterase